MNISRLSADYQKLRELDNRSRIISIERSEGNPPWKYVIGLACKAVVSFDGSGNPSYGYSHRLQIELGNSYPRERPVFTMLTPVIHPNIAANGIVCYGDEGDHGWAPSMRLDDMIIRVVEMIRYQNFNPRSALNLNAANWAVAHQHLFPLDESQIVSEAEIEINLLDDIRIDGGDDLDIRIF